MQRAKLWQNAATYFFCYKKDPFALFVAMPIKLDTMEGELRGKGRERDGERSKTLAHLCVKSLTLSWPASGFLTSKEDCFDDISLCAVLVSAKTSSFDQIQH